ncbi:MAG: hypothetical protein K0B02_00055 [DPANN group archaeon]|nr:hypothetical protein [DPANN group archaeon]
MVDIVILKIFLSVIFGFISLAILADSKRQGQSHMLARHVMNNIGIILFKNEDIKDEHEIELENIELINEKNRLLKNKNFLDKIWLFSNAEKKLPDCMIPDKGIAKNAERHIQSFKDKFMPDLKKTSFTFNDIKCEYDSIRIKIDAFSFKRDEVKKAVQVNLDAFNDILKRKIDDDKNITRLENGFNENSVVDSIQEVVISSDKDLLKEPLDNVSYEIDYLTFPSEEETFDFFMASMRKQIYVIEDDILNPDCDTIVETVRNIHKNIGELMKIYFELSSKIDMFKETEIELKAKLDESYNKYKTKKNAFDNLVGMNEKVILNNTKTSLISREIRDLNRVDS